MNFTSQICTTREQSKRLLALGLKKETADICLRPDNTIMPIHENCFVYHSLENAIQVGYCPAWSLHRLVEMCNNAQPQMTISIYKDEVSVDGDLFEVYDNTYDNLISIIEWLIGLGKFNKEYLE